MSYDLTFFRVPPGADPAQIALSLEDAPVDPAGAPEVRRLAAALQSWRPTLRRFEPPPPAVWLELDDEALQAQLQLFPAYATLAMPHFGARAPDMMRFALGCLETLRAAAGFDAFDPQLGRLVTDADLDRMVAQYRSADPVLRELTKPWWKFW